MFFLFLGFPSGWDKVLALIIGFVIVAVAYSTNTKLKINSDINQADIEKNNSLDSNVTFVDYKSNSKIKSESLFSVSQDKTETINNIQ